MSSVGEAEAIITINAQDNASAEIDRTTKNINRSWVAMRNQQRAVQREFELNNRTLVTTARTLQTVGSVLQRVISVYNTWQLMQIRSALTTKNLRDAQRDLNDIFLEFGGASAEYQDALERFHDLQEQAKRDADSNVIGWGLMIFQMFALAGGLTTRVIPAVKQTSQSITTLTNKLRGIKSPAGVTAKTPTGNLGGATAKSPSVFSKGTNVLKNKLPSTGIKAPSGTGGIGGAFFGGAVSALAFLAGLAGEQQAFAPQTDAQGNVINESEGEVKTGFDQIGQIGKDISVTITNIFNSSTPQQIADDITNATKQGLTFGNGHN